MDKLLMVLGSAGGSGDPRLGTGNSLVDRLNCKYTPMLLGVFAIFITSRYYFGDPITCWTPAWFNHSMDAYTNNVCWVKNTYRLPFEDPPYREYHLPGQLGYQEWPGEYGPHRNPHRFAKEPLENDPRDFVCYYQWVALILCFQAILFYVPHGIWVVLSRKSGISVSTITDAAVHCQRKRNIEERERTIMYIINHMNRFLWESHRLFLIDSKTTTRMFIRTIFYGNYLIIMYFVVKLLYLGNLVLQLFLMNKFLGTDFFMFGASVIKKLMSGQGFWGFRDRFPRVTHCDFYVRVLGHLQRHTVHCTLHINLFNEAIYVMIWFWYVAVSVASILSVLFWLHRCLLKSQRERYITHRLIAMEMLDEETDKQTVKTQVDNFLNKYLCADGVFILRLVTMNASDIIASEIVAGLYRRYLSENRKYSRLASSDIEHLTSIFVRS